MVTQTRNLDQMSGYFGLREDSDTLHGSCREDSSGRTHLVHEQRTCTSSRCEQQRAGFSAGGVRTKGFVRSEARRCRAAPAKRMAPEGPKSPVLGALGIINAHGRARTPSGLLGRRPSEARGRDLERGRPPLPRPPPFDAAVSMRTSEISPN